MTRRAFLFFVILITLYISFITACNNEPAHTHTWDNGIVTTPATCIQSGVKTYTCTGCNQTRTEVILATGIHSWNEGATTVPATCTTAGVKIFTCTVCNLIKTETIPASDHTYETINAKAPTCTEIGWETYRKCKICNAKDGYVEKSILNHTWNSNNICTICGTKNEGTGGITITSTKYTISVDFPENWNGSLTVVPNVLATLKAKLTPENEAASIWFNLEDETGIYEITGDTLELGVGESKLQLKTGVCILTVSAIVDGKAYSEHYTIRVNETGNGIADTQTAL